MNLARSMNTKDYDYYYLVWSFVGSQIAKSGARLMKLLAFISSTATVAAAAVACSRELGD